jgi:MFS family permease
MGSGLAGIFRSLKVFNYRVWAVGALVSNVGSWMQRIAQDWLVLTQLTHRNASAVGVVMALQFGPQLLLLPWTGYAADHFNKHKLLMTTQAILGALAVVLGLLTIAGVVALWHVYVFAFLFGCAAAFDAPVRQTFVAELVGDADMANAIALNSTSFNAARMVGPAVAGLAIASIGTGWAFVANGISFFGVVVSMMFMRMHELRVSPPNRSSGKSLTEGLRYAWSRPDLKYTLIMLALVGTFGLNFSIYISTMAVGTFHSDAAGFGFLSSTMAVGTVTGALLAAGRDRPQFNTLLTSALVFGVGCTLGAIAPNYWLFAVTLVIIGVAALTFINTTNSLMQLATEPTMRGRVMALRLAVALGGTPIGAPIVGWVADHLGPRWALGLGATSGYAAALVAAKALKRHRDLGPIGR